MRKWWFRETTTKYGTFSKDNPDLMLDDGSLSKQFYIEDR